MPIRFEKFVSIVFILGLMGSAILISVVFLTGQTFGQRCVSYGNEKGSESWKQCVMSLSNGDGYIHEP